MNFVHLNSIWNQYFRPENIKKYYQLSEAVEFTSPGSYFIFQSDFFKNICTCILTDKNDTNLLVHTCKFLHCSTNQEHGVSISVEMSTRTKLAAVRLCAIDSKIHSDAGGVSGLFIFVRSDTNYLLKESSIVDCNSPNTSAVNIAYTDTSIDEFNNYSYINSYRHIGPAFFESNIGCEVRFTIISNNTAQQGIALFNELETTVVQNTIVVNNKALVSSFATVLTYSRMMLSYCHITKNSGQPMMKANNDFAITLQSCQIDSQPFTASFVVIKDPKTIDSVPVLFNLRGDCNVPFGFLTLPRHILKWHVTLFMVASLSCSIEGGKNDCK